jgi:hypothetical protein
MLLRNTARVLVVLSSVLLVVVVGVTALSGVDTVSAAHETGDHPDWIHEENHTIQPTTHEPGEKAGVEVWASLPEDERYGAGWQEVWFAANWVPAAFTPEGDEPPCTYEDINTGGIDRGANDSGTTIDESVLSNAKNFWIEKNDAGQSFVMVEMFREDDIGGEHLSLNYTDQVVVVLDECFTMPNQEGWYRVGSYMNGTLWSGDYLEGAGYSHYTYVCSCADREEATELLGPPPVEGYGHEGSRVRARAEELDEAPPDSWDLASQRSPGEGHGTATPTPNGTPGDARTATQTRTPAVTPPPEEATVTATATPTAADDAGGSADGTASPTVSGEDPGTLTDGAAAEQNATPASGDGAGFGPVLALGGLLGGSLLVSRLGR